MTIVGTTAGFTSNEAGVSDIRVSEDITVAGTVDVSGADIHRAGIRVTGSANVSTTFDVSGATTLRTGFNITAGSMSNNARGVPVTYFGGSPAVVQVNPYIQGGSSATGGGSQVFVVFPDAFSAAPQVVVCTARDAVAGTIAVGSITAGSFSAVSSVASLVFNWLAGQLRV